MNRVNAHQCDADGEVGDAETISLSTNPDFIALIERSRASLRAGGGIPLAEVKRRLAELDADET